MLWLQTEAREKKKKLFVWFCKLKIEKEKKTATADNDADNWEAITVRSSNTKQKTKKILKLR